LRAGASEVAGLLAVVGCEVAALGAGAGSVAVAAGPRARVLADARAVPVVTVGAAVRFITGLPRFTGLVRIRRVRWLTGTLRLLRLLRGRRLARVRGEARIEADDDRVVVRGTEHARLVEVDHVVAVAGVLGHHGFGGVDGPVRGAGDTAAAGLVGDDVVQGA